MIERILYVLKGEEFKVVHLNNNRFYITIMTINPKEAEPFIGQRYSVIYYDAAFNETAGGRAIINEVIKPMASLGKGEFYAI